ncbi:MAG: hypothetical protein ACFE75_02525 [Candidatus Hodarchaeota archaeon]
MTLCMLCAVCTNNNQRGRTGLFGLDCKTRYYHEGKIQLENRQLYRNISSAIVWEPHLYDSTLILFDNFYDLYMEYYDIMGFSDSLVDEIRRQVSARSDYQGRFLQITNYKGSGSRYELDSLSDYNFDNRTSSLIEVNNTPSLLRYSFRDLILDEWNSAIDDAFSEPFENGFGGKAIQEGDPILTWQMWPQGIEYLRPYRRYLKIHQKLKIALDWWPDYKASITYYIWLFITWSGRLWAYVPRWEYWVEGGMQTDDIVNGMFQKVRHGATLLQLKIQEKLEIYSDLEFRSIFFLPGRQLSYSSQNIVTGLTTDDVTIILVAKSYEP